MTPEQVELEFEHIKLDTVQKHGQVFEDDTYEDYDKESEADDGLLSDLTTYESEEAEIVDIPKSVEKINPDEWEDVEIDDFEGE